MRIRVLHKMRSRWMIDFTHDLKKTLRIRERVVSGWLILHPIARNDSETKKGAHAEIC